MIRKIHLYLFCILSLFLFCSTGFASNLQETGKDSLIFGPEAFIGIMSSLNGDAQADTNNSVAIRPITKATVVPVVGFETSYQHEYINHLSIGAAFNVYPFFVSKNLSLSTDASTTYAMSVSVAQTGLMALFGYAARLTHLIEMRPILEMGPIYYLTDAGKMFTNGVPRAYLKNTGTALAYGIEMQIAFHPGNSEIIPVWSIGFFRSTRMVLIQRIETVGSTQSFELIDKPTMVENVVTLSWSVEFAV